MFREICDTFYHNKNLLMLISACIYVLSIYSVLSSNVFLAGFIYTILCIFCVVKKYFPLKIIIIWTIIFYFGIINTSFRIKDTDELLNLAPINSEITGKIISIPQNKDGRQKFLFSPSSITYDGITKTLKNEKLLVYITTDEKFGIYDSLKIRGRLSVPFIAGNPSQFDYGNYLKNFGVYSVFYGRNPYLMRNLDLPCYQKLKIKKTNFDAVLLKINNYRERVLEIHSNYLKSPNSEILGGIVFGDDAVNPPDNIKQSFINSGLLHILAASGMNVAFIYSFFFFILNLLKINYKLNISICIFMVSTYVLMTGLGASVLRAALMLIFVLIGKLIDREANSIALLSFVGFLMLIYNPMYLSDVGFQLSFVVTFGLLLMTPYIIKSKSKIINWIIGTLTIPIIAQIWVIPIQIFYFNNISLYSVFANIMSVPVVSIVSFGGFVSSLLSAITPIAHLVCRVFDIFLNPLITIIINISDFWGYLPHSSIQTAHPDFIQLLMYYLILINTVFLFDRSIREKFYKPLKTSLTVLVIILTLTIIPIPNRSLEITAFNVGNADSFLIKTPDNKYIVIDTAKSGYNGGKSQAEMIILKYMKDRGIKNIDSIIITHFDSDHCGGAVDMMKNLNVSKLYVNSINNSSAAAKEIYKTAKERRVEIIKAENNQYVYNSNIQLVNFQANADSKIGDNENSIVTLLTYGEFKMLFTGDAGIYALNNLKKYLPKNITVFKAGHHGASGVINKELFDYLNPKYSVVSTGENKYGHPSAYTMEIMQNSEILRTDIHNAIRFKVDNNSCEVQIFDNKKHKFIKIK